MHAAQGLRTLMASWEASGLREFALQLFTLLLYFGGGHPLPALFTPTIRVPLRATQAGSRYINAKR